MVRHMRLIWTENGEKCFFRTTERRLERSVRAAKARADGRLVQIQDERDAMLAECEFADREVPTPGEDDLAVLWNWKQALLDDRYRQTPAWRREMERVNTVIKIHKLDRSARK